MNKVNNDDIMKYLDAMEHIKLLENDLWESEKQTISLANSNVILDSNIATNVNNLKIYGRTLNNILGNFGNPRKSYLPTSNLKSGLKFLKNCTLLYDKGSYMLTSDSNPEGGSFYLGAFDEGLNSFNYSIKLNKYYLALCEVSHKGDLPTKEDGKTIHFGGSICEIEGKENAYDSSYDIDSGNFQLIYKAVHIPEIWLSYNSANLNISFPPNSTIYVNKIRLYEIDENTYNLIDIDSHFSGDNLGRIFHYVDSVTGIKNPHIMNLGNLLEFDNCNISIRDDETDISDMLISYNPTYKPYKGEIFSLYIEGLYKNLFENGEIEIGIGTKSIYEFEFLFKNDNFFTFNIKNLNLSVHISSPNIKDNKLIGDTGITTEMFIESIKKGETKIYLVKGENKLTENELNSSMISFDCELFTGENIETKNGEYVIDNKFYDIKNLDEFIKQGIDVYAEPSGDTDVHQIRLVGLPDIDNINDIIDPMGRIIPNLTYGDIKTNKGYWMKAMTDLFDEYLNSIIIGVPNLYSGWGEGYYPTKIDTLLYLLGLVLQRKTPDGKFSNYTDNTYKEDKYYCIREKLILNQDQLFLGGDGMIATNDNIFLCNDESFALIVLFKINDSDDNSNILTKILEKSYFLIRNIEAFNNYKIIYKYQDNNIIINSHNKLSINNGINYLKLSSNFYVYNLYDENLNREVLGNTSLSSYTNHRLYNFKNHYDKENTCNIISNQNSVNYYAVDFELSKSYLNVQETLVKNKSNDIIKIPYDIRTYNNNILDNSNFKINNLGKLPYISTNVGDQIRDYYIDRWFFDIADTNNNIVKINVENGNELVITSATTFKIKQYINFNFEEILKKSMTVSLDYHISMCDENYNILPEKNFDNNVNLEINISLIGKNGKILTTYNHTPFGTLFGNTIYPSKWNHISTVAKLTDIFINKPYPITNEVEYIEIGLSMVKYNQSANDIETKPYELRIKNIKAEIGETETPHVSKSDAEEYINCSKWYQTTYFNNSKDIGLPRVVTHSGINRTTRIYVPLDIHFSIPMIKTPTIEVFGNDNIKNSYFAAGWTNMKIGTIESLQNVSEKGFLGMWVTPDDGYTCEQLINKISTDTILFHYRASCNPYIIN